MTQDKWTQQFRDKLAGHEMAAPEGLWSDIEAALPAEGSQTRRVRVVMIRRWAVAASLAALLMGGGYWAWNRKNADFIGQKTAKQETPTSSAQKDIPLVAQEAPVVSPEPLISAAEAPVVSSEPLISAAEAPKAEETIALAEPVVSTETERSTKQQTADDQQIENDQQTENIHQPLPDQGERDILQRLDREIANSNPAGSHTMKLSLYAQNGMENRNNTNGILMSQTQLNRYDYSSYMPDGGARQRTTAYLANYEEHENHHRPFSLGLSLTCPLSERLALSSGLVYTRLSADFLYVMGSHRSEKEQTLHYVGIPMSLQYMVWRQGGFRFYAAAGGQVDWNVGTSLVSDGVTQEMGRDRLQFSLLGSVGAQYDVLPQLGLYLEPGVRYYPDNGSQVRTYFKDKPLSLSLQAGLRLSLGR